MEEVIREISRIAEVKFEEREDFAGYKSKPLAVVIPENQEQVIQVFRICKEHSVPIIAWGSGTNLTGAASCKNCVIIDLSKLNKIIEFNDVDWYVRVEPGIILENLNKFLMERGFFFPPDPASSFLCTVGGAIAEGSGGMRCVRYGTMKDWVLALKVLLPNGDVVKLGEPLNKNRAGYDLVHLFVGSEGTLGIILEAWLKIIPLPKRERKTVFAYVKDLESAAEVILEMRKRKILPDISEYMDDEVIKALNKNLGANIKESKGGALFIVIEVDYFDDLMDILKGRADEIVIAKSKEEEEEFYSLRAKAAVALKPEGKLFFAEDIVVPISKLSYAIRRMKELAQKYNAKLPVIAHIGDGNLHPNIIFAEEEFEKAKELFNEICKIVIELGGSVTGEHGVGIQKVEVMAEQIVRNNGFKVLEIMNEIKRIMDRENIMNPGKYVEAAYKIAKERLFK